MSTRKDLQILRALARSTEPRLHPLWVVALRSPRIVLYLRRGSDTWEVNQ